MNQLQRTNGNRLDLARPLPPRREPERVRVPDDERLPVVYNVWSVVLAWLISGAIVIAVGSVVLTAIAFRLEAMLRAAAGG